MEGISMQYTSNILLSNVDHYNRPGLGNFYQGKLPLSDLYKSLVKGDVRYAPKYQKGFRNSRGEDLPDAHYEQLYQIWDERLDISHERAREMACKFLMGIFFNVELVWNARTDHHLFELPKYFADKRQLSLDSLLTIPDTGHRHQAYYLLVDWYYNPHKIPKSVTVNESPISKEEISELYDKVDFDPEKYSASITVFCLPTAIEGKIFNERNRNPVKPTNGIQIALDPQSTPVRRFLYKLMNNCPIISEKELEMRRSNIGNKSRKLVPVSALESALKPLKKKLFSLEKDPQLHLQLVQFTSEFIKEWASYYPEMQPGAPGEKRQHFRETSFAFSNIIIFPLFEISFNLWSLYNEYSINWRSDPNWKTLLAKLHGTVEVIQKDGKKAKVPVMSRENPQWQGVIIARTMDKKGNEKWTLQNNRITQKSAFQYLSQTGGLNDFKQQLKSLYVNKTGTSN